MDRSSLFNQQNIAVFLALLLYCLFYALVETMKARKDALFPAALWGDIILCSAVVVATTQTVLQSMYMMNND
jgi:ABC-type enterochelin transport system permease subunit